MKRALVTGITGQDGAYLAQLLLGKGYRVVGTHRAAAPPDCWRLRELGIDAHPGLSLMAYDMRSLDASLALLANVKPDEIYNLAAQSSAVDAAADPHGTAESNGMAAVHLLEAVRRLDRNMRFFQAGSAEMFGDAASAPQNEETPFRPNNAYAVAKLFAHWAAVDYRQTHGLFASCGLLFNHESPLRGNGFVTRKITCALAAMRLGRADVLDLGDLGAQRDWGFAGDYVHGMWCMLQLERPATYVLATGKTCTVREFVSEAAHAAGLELVWKGHGMQETGVDRGDGRVRVRVNPAFFRPRQQLRIGDPAKARRDFGWDPATGIAELARMMVDADVRRQRTATMLSDTPRPED